MISIAGMSSLRGEREIPIAELAAAHETTDAAVLRSMGASRRYATDRPQGELVIEVAKAATEEAVRDADGARAHEHHLPRPGPARPQQAAQRELVRV
jgi:3-oxoacyl-[acyl-carrier-protein] synthase III